MGQSNNNPFREGGELMSDYSIIAKIPEQSITLLNHKKTKKDYLLRQQTFNDLRDFALNSEKLKNRKNITNPHLTNLIKIEERSEDHLCSNFYKIYTLWEYPHKSLEDQINERALLKNRFESTELWSILACSIMGLATLEEQQIKHECLTPKSIVTDYQGNVKIVDPVARGLVPNIDCVYNNRSIKHVYLSPEQCESIETQRPIINKNPYKNDVFVLGMLLLECGLLQRQDQCYLNDCSEVNFDKIQANLNKFGQIYEEELRKMIELMLNRDIRNRPDWTDLLKHVNRNSKNNKDAANPKIESRTSQRHFITRVLATQAESKKQNNANKTTTAQPQKSLFYKDQQTLQTGPYPTANTKTLSENKVQNVPFQIPVSISQNTNVPPITTTVNKGPQYSYKPIYYQNYAPPTIQQTNPFTITFSNPQQFQSNPPPYFLPPLPQVNIPSQTQQFSSSSNNNTFSTFNPQTQNLPRIGEDKQSIASNLTGILDQKLHFSHNNQYIRPAESFNYQITNFNKPTFSNYAFDPKLTKTPQLGDNSQLQIHPTFVEQHFKMGSRYQGYKLNGQRHGKGKFFYQDGGSYDGQWKENKMDGYGTLYYQSFEKAYEGNWKNDQFQGFGKLYNEHPNQLNQNFDYKDFDDIDEYWVSYEGNFHEDLKDGKGRLKFSNGQIFQGTFKDDMIQGQGTFYSKNGVRIQGIWNENHLVQILSQQYLTRQ